MLFHVDVDAEVVEEFCEELEAGHVAIEGIIINLENQHYDPAQLNEINRILHELAASTVKLSLVPLTESLVNLIYVFDKLINAQLFPNICCEYMLLLNDRILFITREIQQNFTINIQETQNILVSLQHILEAKDDESLEKSIITATQLLTQTISLDNDDNTVDLNIDLFDDDEPEIFSDTPSNVEPHPPAIFDGIDAIEYAKEFIESFKLINPSLVMLAQIADQAIYSKKNHTTFVLELCLSINMLAGKPLDEEPLCEGVLLHDIALSSIPNLINKPGKLNREELEILRRHPIEGAVIAEALSLSEEAKVVITQHHERINGSGYPYGLKGDEISDSGKLVAILDSFHAMVDNRPHKKFQRGPLRAIAEINAGVDTAYDKFWIGQFNHYMKNHWLPNQKTRLH